MLFQTTINILIIQFDCDSQHCARPIRNYREQIVIVWSDEWYSCVRADGRLHICSSPFPQAPAQLLGCLVSSHLFQRLPRDSTVGDSIERAASSQKRYRSIMRCSRILTCQWTVCTVYCTECQCSGSRSRYSSEWCQVNPYQWILCAVFMSKLDGVGPIDNRPSTV